VCSSLAQQTGGALNGRSQALEALNRASNQSYTDSLIRQMQGGSGAAIPQHVDHTKPPALACTPMLLARPKAEWRRQEIYA
jgi:hypothetical protein